MFGVECLSWRYWILGQRLRNWDDLEFWYQAWGFKNSGVFYFGLRIYIGFRMWGVGFSRCFGVSGFGAYSGCRVRDQSAFGAQKDHAEEDLTNPEV